MALTAIYIKGYRSVRRIYLPIAPLSVFVGGNGVGKTNLYNALKLLRSAADGTIARAIAQEGGIESVLWAGPRRRHESATLTLRADFESRHSLQYSYELAVGLPAPLEAAFKLEPLVKEERIVLVAGARKTTMMERKRGVVMLRNAEGSKEMVTDAVLSSETALATFRDAVRYPELGVVRQELLGARLYHDFRTDAGSPIRKPSHAITTPTLSSDGHDLSAVLATLSIIRKDTAQLDSAIEDAFPGSKLHASNEGSWCNFTMQFADMPQRAFTPQELSDGTLKYLCLLGALMGYRLPPFIALNEPEGSLHPSLLQPLARLVTRAARDTRIWLVTHSESFAEALRTESGTMPMRVIKVDGATMIEGLKLSGEFEDEP